MLKAATAAEIAPYVARSMGFDTMAGNQGADQLIRNGQPYLVMREGQAVAGIVVQQDGTELFITAAAGSDSTNLTAALLALVEKVAAGKYRTVAFQTIRPGLLKKAMDEGYEIGGYIMRKAIQ